jgi:taurine dioxygenase
VAAAPARTLEVERVAGALGAVVTGIDLTAVTEPSEVDGLRHALNDHLVVFLPGQDLGLDDLERVTDLLGGRDLTPFVDPMEGRPHVIRVVKEPGDVLNFANTTFLKTL